MPAFDHESVEAPSAAKTPFGPIAAEMTDVRRGIDHASFHDPYAHAFDFESLHAFEYIGQLKSVGWTCRGNLNWEGRHLVRDRFRRPN